MIWRSRELGRMRTAASSPQGFFGSWAPFHIWSNAANVPRASCACAATIGLAGSTAARHRGATARSNEGSIPLPARSRRNSRRAKAIILNCHNTGFPLRK
jgi:hypothetical protein